MALVFLLLHLLFSSLDGIGDELARPRGKAEALVLYLVSCAEATAFIFLLMPPLFWSLAIAREVLAHWRRNA